MTWPQQLASPFAVHVHCTLAQDTGSLSCREAAEMPMRACCVAHAAWSGKMRPLVYVVCCAAQDKDGPKALDEFCRDLCEEVRLNKIDPVSTNIQLDAMLGTHVA